MKFRGSASRYGVLLRSLLWGRYHPRHHVRTKPTSVLLLHLNRCTCIWGTPRAGVLGFICGYNCIPVTLACEVKLTVHLFDNIYHQVDCYTYIELHADVQMRVTSSADTTGLRCPDNARVTYLNLDMGGRGQAPAASPPG